MNTEFKTMCDELQDIIQNSYEEGITMPEAEKLAGRFIHAQIQVANHLSNSDLDARMKKSGVKAIEAAVYLEVATKDAKKPSDTFIGAMVDSDKTVIGQKEAQDRAEVYRNELQNYLNIFREAHIYYRGISRAKFE